MKGEDLEAIVKRGCITFSDPSLFRKMSSNLKVHSFEEVSKHNHQKDCWLIISGKVFDVTQFLDDHPGGDEVLITATGKDATDDFEDVGHSDSAREMLDKYLIGEIDVNTLPLKDQYIPPPKGVQNDSSSSVFIKLLQFVVPLLILGLAFYLKQYGKKE
ncbi:cytochrome b5-like [Impatiens glandulifera]|uniref:cytochrome b5-like n=1 Tax=Impatiens glandulifera TaxID=253017 RepID=UPI001FB15610|nr:cytochrome b5-like [Impatiens glandulifera]